MNIGLFFGSFNPVHMGHLIIASQLVEYTNLDQVWFVVSPHNPLKARASLLNEYDRYHLVELAIGNDYRFRASNVEFSLPKPSYSVDTLAYLTDKHPQHNFSLIMGGDNLATLNKWKNYEAILAHYKIYVYNRPGYETTSELKDHPSIETLSFPQMDISASYIRKSVQQNLSIQYLVPEPVRAYIEDMGLFKTND